MRVSLFNSLALAGALLALHVDAVNLREAPIDLAEIDLDAEVESADAAKAATKAAGKAVTAVTGGKKGDSMMTQFSGAAKKTLPFVAAIGGALAAVKGITELGGMMNYGCGRGNYSDPFGPGGKFADLPMPPPQIMAAAAPIVAAAAPVVAAAAPTVVAAAAPIAAPVAAAAAPVLAAAAPVAAKLAQEESESFVENALS